MELTIREMQPTDWEDVRRIYQEGLNSEQASFETEVPAWEEWDQSHHAHSRLVACLDDRVLAWAALSPSSKRVCYAGVAEVSLYVADTYHGLGIGKQLFQALIEASEKNHIWTLYGSTFPENEASLRMQLSCGFRVVGRREKIARHHGLWRDTIITERRSKVIGVGGS